jgi:pre-mRNA-processing factor 40
MSDSDRHLYFADFVIELQSIEDDKRRRIRDARRRAEKAQREAYRELLKKLGSERKILPSTRWRSIEEVVSMNEPFNLVQAQDRDSPRALFEEFVGEWDDVYHRDRSFLSRLLHPNNRKEIIIEAGTSYEEFTKLLLDEAALSQEVYGDTRRIINSQEPISSAHLYHDELISLAVENERRTSGRRRTDEESSEDEGEIIEDEESPAVDDGDCDKPSSDGALPEAKSHVELAEKDSQEFSKKSKSDARLVREALVEGKEREDSSKNTEISQKITESGLEKELQEKGESR